MKTLANDVIEMLQKKEKVAMQTTSFINKIEIIIAVVF
jgi:hypothetical protein